MADYLYTSARMNSRYEVRDRIGQGGLGSVFKAYDHQLQRDVAMKRVLTTGQGTQEEIMAAGQKLIAEAQTLSSLNHPNIITVFDVGQDEQGGFVVMELLDGETLDQTVERGVLTVEDFTEVVYQTMEGLVTAQDKNVIHRDIKPTNIMLIWQASGRFQLKILDFGLAKFSKNPSVQTMDQDDAVMGSIFFMAPEQFERGELDARTDLYQMGCVYYNSLTGQYPFNGETAPQVMNAHLQHKVVPIEQLRPDLPPALAQWVMWLINRDIESRPSNAKEALKYFPKSSGQAPALPTQAQQAPAPASPQTGSSKVKVATPGAKASAPPNLRVGATPGNTTGRLQTGAPAAGAAPAARTTAATGAGAAAAAGARPGAAAAGAGAAGRQMAAPPEKKKLPIATIIVSAVGAVLILGIVGFMVMKNKAAAKNEQRLEALYSADEPSGNSEDVQMLVGFMISDKSTTAQKSEAAKALRKLDGSDVDREITSQMQAATGSLLRKTLAGIIADRGYGPAADSIIGYATSTKKTSDKKIYLSAAKSIAGSKNLPVYLQGLKSAQDLALRRIYEDSILSLIQRAPNSSSMLKDLRTKVNGTSGGERRSILRILGVAGGAETAAMLDGIFAGSDQSLKQDAMAAYTAWPNREPLPAVAQIITNATPEERSLKTTAQRAYVELTGKPGPVTIDQEIADWQKGLELLEGNGSDIGRLLQKTNESPHPKTVEMLEGLKDNASYGRVANAMAQGVQKSIGKLPVLGAGDELKGNKARVNGKGAGFDSFLESASWSSADTSFTWNFKAKEAGNYSVAVNQADLNDEASDFIIYLNGATFTGKSSKTPNREDFTTVVTTGQVALEAGAVYKLTLVAGPKVQPRMMDIGSVTLVKE